MNKRCTIPALICAGALLLTGCGRKTDLSRRYPEMFSHAFGDGYTFTYESTDGNDKEYDNYTIEYTEVTGTRHRFKTSITPYNKSRFKDNYADEEDYYLSQASSLITNEISDLMLRTLIRDVIQPNIPTAGIGGNGSAELGPEGEDGFVLLYTAPICTADDDDPTVQKLAADLFDPQNGLRLSALKPETVLSDDRFCTTFVVNLKPDADADVYQRQFETAAAALKQLGLRNYAIVLRASPENDGEKSTTLYREYGMFGEVVDIDARQAQWTDGDYAFAADIRRELVKKHTQS